MEKRNTPSPARDWRASIGAGARFVARNEDGLIWAEVAPCGTVAILAGARSGPAPLSEVLTKAIGRLTKEQATAAARSGNPTDPALLEEIVGASTGWVYRDGGLTYDPEARPHYVAACSSSEVALLARCSIMSLFAVVTDRTADEAMHPRFFATIADTARRFDRLLVTCEAASPRPIHLELVVDHVDRRTRSVLTKVITKAVTERAVPRGADDA